MKKLREYLNKKILNYGKVRRIFESSSKDAFIWLTLFNKFTKLKLDDNKFAEFLHSFVNGLRDVSVDGKLFEETGITKDNVNLQFIRHEQVVSETSNNGGTWSMFVTAGILKRDVTLIPEKNPLLWVNLCDWNKLVQAQGNGSCLMYMLEARNVLGF